MGQILVRNLDDAVLVELKRKASERNVSLEQLARDVLAEAAKPSREDVNALLKQFRERVGSVSGDSTAYIRKMRDDGWRSD